MNETQENVFIKLLGLVHFVFQLPLPHMNIKVLFFWIFVFSTIKIIFSLEENIVNLHWRQSPENLTNSSYIPTFKEVWRHKTIADNFMYIPNDDTQNSLLCRLQLVVETFIESINKFIKSKSSKLLSQRIDKLSLINSPLSPSFLK